ncbi:DEAD/DEAH box helicase [Chakrabartyella piscis]|uniref:DEAD/DEAH box helicase n=1 Tax=Chakrabartyella piscis TaxID=2918914 RepID=UPI0029583716|nr:DEAD/DEAH box helicase [Chakrabartyella piscis]
MEKNFKDLGLSDDLVLALEKQGITNPTEIQTNLVPLLQEKKDIVARSETGSGKTLSYLLPIIEKLDMNVRGAQAIILTPTHELAAQVCKQAELLEENSGLDIGCMLVIGSAGISRQMEKLKAKPKLIVGSTGRILDLIGRKKIPAHLVKTIVLDEGDRLMEDGNFEDVKAIVRTTLKERQIVLLSASVPEETRNRVATLMKEDYISIEAKTGGIVPRGIAHYYMLTTQRDKFPLLRKIIAGEKPKRAMVFLNNPENIEVTVDKLCHHGIQAAGIYGQANKIDRKNAMDDFRAGRISVLVASDIGARGLDIEGVTHIINLDVPEEPTHYLHRAGRCGRKGEEGTAITLVTPYERRWVHKYAKVWGLKFVQKEMSYGKLVDSTKTKKDLDLVAPDKRKSGKMITIYEDEMDDFELDFAPKKSVKPQQAKSKKPAKSKAKEEKMGFFAKKAKKLEEKEKNRQQNQKK